MSIDFKARKEQLSTPHDDNETKKNNIQRSRTPKPIKITANTVTINDEPSKENINKELCLSKNINKVAFKKDVIDIINKLEMFENNNKNDIQILKNEIINILDDKLNEFKENDKKEDIIKMVVKGLIKETVDKTNERLILINAKMNENIDAISELKLKVEDLEQYFITE